MKIAFIVNNEYPGLQPTGGIGVFVRNLCLGLKEQKEIAEVILLSTILKIEETQQVEGITIHVLPFTEARNIFSLQKQRSNLQARIESLLEKGEYDIVEVSTSDSFLRRKLRHHTVVARTHGSLSYALKHYYKSSGYLSKKLQLKHEHILLKQATKVICISKQYYTHYASLKDKLELVPNFIGREFNASQKLPSPYEFQYVFFHGTIKDIKGIKELAEAFIKSDYAATHKLVIAGKTSKTYLQSLETICKGTLVYAGTCDALTLISLLQHCEVAVYPSKRDAFNLAVVEAMSQHALVLCSSAIDSEIISDNVNGIVCPLEELENLHVYLNKVHAMSAEDKAKLKTKAYEDYKKKYSFEVGVHNNLNFYNSISS